MPHVGGGAQWPKKKLLWKSLSLVRFLIEGMDNLPKFHFTLQRLFKETLKSKMEFWEIVHHARKSELVKDEFVDRLMREGLSTNTNEELVTQFLKEITVQSGWFDRFTSILGGSSQYRHLAVQLNDGEFGRNIETCLLLNYN